jgi:MFS family permease
MFNKHCSHLRHNMRVSTADATSFGMMVGVGETYLPAFALAIGLGEVTAGLVGSLPLLIGGLLQAVSPWILQRGVSEKVWVVSASILQGCAFVPLMFAAMVGQMPGWGLMLCASMYWAGGLAGGPAWNSWIDKLIPKPVRANFFAGRSRAAQLATASGFLLAGALLQWSKSGAWETQAFAILFALAWLARNYSVYMLVRHRTPDSKPLRKLISLPAAVPPTGMLQSPAGLRVVSPRTLIMYLALTQGMIQVSGPFYTPYMLKHLDMSYLGFAVLIATMFTAKIVALASWGQFAKRQGAQWLLMIGGALIIPAPALWILSSNYAWLMMVQTLSGIGWAAYELGFFLLLFDSVPIVRRVRLLTIYNLANTTAWCGGAAVGAWILYQLAATPSAYYTLFALSAIGRGLAYCFLLTHCGSAAYLLRQRSLSMLRIPLVRRRTASVQTPIESPTIQLSEELAA